MRPISRARWPWLVLVSLLLGGLAVAAVGDSDATSPEEQVRSISESIKCPTCQGQSVADSNASAAKAIRTEIGRRLEEGQTEDQIRGYIASRYGEESLLTPPRSGVAGLIWFLPVAFGVGAIGGLIAAFRFWRTPADAEASDEDVALVEAAMNNPNAPDNPGQ